MNELLTHNEEGPVESYLMFTRPSPLVPEGVNLGVLEVGRIRSPKGEVFPIAESYFCTLVWVLSGSFSFYVDDLRYTARAGEFLALDPGGDFRVDGDDEVNDTYYLLLDGRASQRLLTDTGIWSEAFPWHRPPMSWLERIAQGIEKLDQQENLGSIGHALLVTMEKDAHKNAPDREVWEACQYIQRNWNQKGLNVEKILRYFKISRSTLSPRFRKVTGMSMLDYLMDIRYRKALFMLQHERDSISKISKRCGFLNTSYFTTWFQKRRGCPPSEMRKNKQS